MTRKRDDMHVDATDADEKELGSIHRQPPPADEGGEIDPAPPQFRTEPTEDPGVIAEADEAGQLRRRVAELEDRLLRAAADFDNYRKRTARQYEEMEKAAADRVLTDLLDIVDNFRRALDNAGDTADGDPFRQGIAMIYEQMNALLARHGVQPIEALGRPFDPNLHDALMQMASEEHGEGTVAMVMSPGYRRGDRVLRHAKVGVSTGKPA